MRGPIWTEIITAIASIFSVLVTFGGFLSIRRQIGLARSSLRTNTVAELYRQQNSLTIFFIEHQDLRPFFYEHCPIAEDISEKDLKELMTVAEMVTDFTEHVFLQLPNLTPDIRLGWENYISKLYKQSPAIKRHLEDNGPWYSSELLEFLERTETKPHA